MLSGMHDFSGNKLSPLQPTLASVLKQAGYQTGAVIGAAVLDSRFGLNQGFDFYYDHFEFSRLDEANLDEMERPGNVVADVALNWLEKDWLAKNSQKKFFLWMHLYDPHFPYHPPEPYSSEYAAQPYDGEIAFADEQVGRLVAVSEREGDLSEHDHRACGRPRRKPWRAWRKDAWILHLQLDHACAADHSFAGATARAVAGENHGAHTSNPVSLVDLMPTVLSAAGLEVPSQVQGRNLLREIRPDSAAPDAHVGPRAHALRRNFSAADSLQLERTARLGKHEVSLHRRASDPSSTI